MKTKRNRRNNRPRRVLRLLDLEHVRTAVLDSLSSPESQRGYRHVIDEFVDWYCSEPRLAFNRIVGASVSKSPGIPTIGPCDYQPSPGRRSAAGLRGRRLRTAQLRSGSRDSACERPEEKRHPDGKLAEG
jgi:hypothetical protein